MLEEAQLVKYLVAASLELSASWNFSIAQEKAEAAAPGAGSGARRVLRRRRATTPVAAAVGYPRALRL